MNANSSDRSSQSQDKQAPIHADQSSQASAPALQAGQGEPIGWLKPNENYAPDVFRWERTNEHTRPLFASPTHERAAPAPEPIGQVYMSSARTPSERDQMLVVLGATPSQPVAAEGVTGEQVCAEFDELSKRVQWNSLSAVNAAWHAFKCGVWFASKEAGISASKDSAKGGKP